jgi:chlorobactene glucosyltransferase
VSVLIPARNEAAVIEATLHSLLTQSHPNFEIILLDDHSTDATAAIAARLAKTEPRLRVITGQPLPTDWLGKNWACHQLAQAAQGNTLLFTDADVSWQPGALAALTAEMARTGADLLTVWPTQRTQTWAERLVVPLMSLVTVGYLPWPLVHFSPWPVFAAANGQCMAFTRRAYREISGHSRVRANVLEDVTLSRLVKAHGLRLRMADAAGLITCRMYPDWPAVRDGFAKNILAGYGGRVSLLLLAALFHWLVFVLPWPALAVDARFAAPLVLGLGVRALSAAATRQRVSDALLMPLSVLWMTRIAGQAISWQWRYGGPLWKGRLIASQPAQRVEHGC